MDQKPLTQQALEEWKREVDREEARMIRDGVEPWRAAALAPRLVQHRREQRAAPRWWE